MEMAREMSISAQILQKRKELEKLEHQAKMEKANDTIDAVVKEIAGRDVQAAVVHVLLPLLIGNLVELGHLGPGLVVVLEFGRSGAEGVGGFCFFGVCSALYGSGFSHIHGFGVGFCHRDISFLMVRFYI